jgi:ribosomal protein L37AE/L43A
MILAHRCQYCGDLATTRADDGTYLCDKLQCEATQQFPQEGQQ